MKNFKRVTIITAILLLGIAIWLPALRSRGVAAQSPTPSGTYGFSINIPYTGDSNATGVLQGTVTLDGAGNVTSNGGLIVVPASNSNASSPQVQPLLANTGTYTVNPDGTGSMTFPNPNGNTFSLSFVSTDGGSQFMFVVTSGLGNAVGTGIARRQ